MYIPVFFHNKNLSRLESFIRDNPFAILVNQQEGKPVTTHIPVEPEENSLGEKILWCHELEELNDYNAKIVADEMRKLRS